MTARHTTSHPVCNLLVSARMRLYLVDVHLCTSPRHSHILPRTHKVSHAKSGCMTSW